MGIKRARKERTEILSGVNTLLDRAKAQKELNPKQYAIQTIKNKLEEHNKLCPNSN